MEPERTSLNVGRERALLVSVALPDANVDTRASLDELAALAEAAGAEVVGCVYQKRLKINPALYVGKGKAQQITQRALQNGANVIIFDNDLSPAQIRDLEKITQCKVLDRSELILDIFASRAQTYEAKLQVELAQLEYTYPRLTRMWSHLDTVVGGPAAGAAAAVGGIGTRGPGESQLEIDRRLVQKRIVALRRQIRQIDQRKQRQVRARREHFTVCLIGYTNAGKSTLMNTLTGANTFVEDKLFATLDTRTSRWNLGQDHSVLLSDTVGFIRELPHHLVASFRATLEEAIHTDLLLHVVDVAHPQAEMQMLAAHQVLKDIGCHEKDIIVLFNKIDLISCSARRETMTTLYPDALPISARHGTGLDRLVDVVTARLTGERLRLRVSCPQADGRVPSFLRAHGTIISETFNDSQVTLEAQLGRRQLPGLQRLCPHSYKILSAQTSPSG